ncbi:MAG: hypothetical protein NVS9B1_00830 [Candidatus Dormibacteraceae bacterium]
MQNPPGPPAAASSGLDKKTSSFLAYLAIWVTGIIFLFVGKNDADVKYNAAQSVVFFGGLSVLRILLGIATNLSGIGGVFGIINLLVSILMFVGWIYCLYKAWTTNGAQVDLPGVGSIVRPLAERLAASV